MLIIAERKFTACFITLICVSLQLVTICTNCTREFILASFYQVKYDEVKKNIKKT